MSGIVTFIVIAGAFALVLWLCLRLAARARRLGVSGHLLGVVQEIYHPTAYEAQSEIEVQDEQLATKPTPTDS